jgi:hypothetical protein
MLLNPFCPISAAKIAGLKATVALLLILLIKSKLLRVKMSLLGSLLAFHMLVAFLITTGLLTVVAGGAVAYAASQRKPA